MKNDYFNNTFFFSFPVFQSLTTSMDFIMVVLCVLYLCVCVSLAVLTAKALTSQKKKKEV